MATRAPFIVLEGLDRSGKTTQASSLFTRLQSQGLPVQALKFPDRTTHIGKMIDEYLKQQSEHGAHAIHLLFAANRWERAEDIISYLDSGTVVIADRYAFSGLAFSAAKGLSYEWCAHADRGLPAPDLTLFLDVDPETARQRGGYGEERYEKEGMQRAVRSVFERVGKDVSEGGDRWVVIDASQSMKDVEDAIWKNVQTVLAGMQGLQATSRLWDKSDL